MFNILIFLLLSMVSSSSFAMRTQNPSRTATPIRAYSASTAPLSLLKAGERVKEGLRDIIFKMHNGRGSHTDDSLYSTYQMPEIPGYIIKNRLNRIAGARMVKNTISSNQLTLLQVPEMLAVEIPQQMRDEFRYLHMRLPSALCLAQFVAGTQHRPLTKQQTMQMAQLILRAEQSPYLKEEDYVCTPEGNIGLIDTKLDKFSQNNFERALDTYIFFYHNNRLEFEAREYLKELFKQEFGFTVNYLERN